jgi:hypothetical protein
MPRRCTLPPIARFAAGLTALTAAFAAGTGPAAAQVSATGGPAGPGATRVTFTVAQGCAGSPTTSLVVRLPEDTADVTAEPPPGWQVRVTAGELAWAGRSGDGAVTLTATMRIPGMAGDVVFLPAVQTCAAGELSWTSPSEDPAAPGAAPRVQLTVSYLPRKTPPATAAPATAPPATVVSTSTGPADAPGEGSTLASVLGAAGAVTLLAVVFVGILVARRGGEA